MTGALARKDNNVGLRRVSPIAEGRGDGLLPDQRAVAQPWQRTGASCPIPAVYGESGHAGLSAERGSPLGAVPQVCLIQNLPISLDYAGVAI